MEARRIMDIILFLIKTVGEETYIPQEIWEEIWEIQEYLEGKITKEECSGVSKPIYCDDEVERKLNELCKELGIQKSE